MCVGYIQNSTMENRRFYYVKRTPYMIYFSYRVVFSDQERRLTNMSEKGEIAKDVYYTTERFNRKTEDIDLNIMTAQEKTDIYIAGA